MVWAETHSVVVDPQTQTQTKGNIMSFGYDYKKQARELHLELLKEKPAYSRGEIIEDAIRLAFEEGAQSVYQQPVGLEESLYGVDRREELVDADYGDCTRLHFSSFGKKFVLDIYYDRGERDLAETTLGIFKEETVA